MLDGDKMALFVIGDLHLSISSEKPMGIFGSNWENHHNKIQKNWIENIRAEDTILIPGDISWAMDHEQAKEDLDWINNLPGRKILLKGNHDYWWGSIQRLNSMYSKMDFLQNNYYIYDDIAICGARGWTCPNESKYTEHDKKIYSREINRLKLSLDQAVRNNHDKIFVMTHYPPTNDQKELSDFTRLYEFYGVKKVFYGHLHGEESFEGGLKGNVNGVEYYLTSSDYLDFNPLKVL